MVSTLGLLVVAIVAAAVVVRPFLAFGNALSAGGACVFLCSLIVDALHAGLLKS